jgi:hypothetical protein
MRATAKDHGEGFGPAVWKLGAGEATYMTGVGYDGLYFAVPLRGDFEVSAQVTTAANRGVRFVYAGTALSIMDDGITVVRGEVGASSTNRTRLTEKISGWKPTIDFRLAVAGGTLAVFVNDQQVHKETLPAEPDPWLAIESRSGNQTGAVKALRISGTPTVPSAISLSSGFGLEGWSAAYYGEKQSEETEPNRRRMAQPMLTPWSKQGDEIRVNKLPHCEGSYRESVLQYHRPLVDDGEVEYEFLYEPGKTEVHPAVGRVALLLKPGGVEIHQMTDAQYDRTGLAPDNATPLARSQPTGLKAGEWNKVKLTLAGEEVAVAVNGMDVGRTKVGPASDRVFGLFRYADASGVRARNVTYRGNWPKALPPIDAQELAQAK